MTQKTCTVLGAVLMIAATSLGVSAQSPTAPRSTKDGVFTAAQAAAGGDVYAGACTGCHTRASHSGLAFWKAWDGALVFDLYDFLRQTMPQDNPGGLSAGEYTLVIAFLLDMNGMPAGSDALPSDPAALKKIRIDSVGARPRISPLDTRLPH